MSPNNDQKNGGNASVVNVTNATSLSQAELEDLQDAFQLFDTENKGIIAVSELREVLQSLAEESGVPSKNSIMSRIFLAMKKIPDDKNLTLADFIKLLTEPDPNDKRDEIQKVFDMFDVDNKGFINQGDLRKIASEELGETMADEELEEMIERAASNDGKVTMEDFTEVMTKQLFS
jgi:Ca2+-binding EF-hand superfamily protein